MREDWTWVLLGIVFEFQKEASRRRIPLLRVVVRSLDFTEYRMLVKSFFGDPNFTFTSRIQKVVPLDSIDRRTVHTRGGR